MIRPIKVVALPEFRIRITYSDGVEGIIDLSANVGKGVFAPLRDPVFFRQVYVGQFGQIAWSNDIEICPDAAYQDITSAKAAATHA
jgi:hypothetical protein